ncbi:putative KHG/KDPG aldolase (Includes: 4-hydroxy-2-oxoglutarate aldolase; 2-dehydro-3-deoxy-phosphogluconate aldolase) [uncultured spirochete]|uniref:2-dehydro-3-deoxy-phosphogluconate aldolase n=1 Tax=uncultured spirochete TaxID=156406 RepID=A0A3P3XQ45_9SPIR|nr:putative KHG/KDPG aldolase (Includes: 4-hydroxy-2-oxoglutarate aldolase; 2-dehydro-3-deoxy-phosphogluconate aldolase) [uncultured spirochete]
MNSIFDEIKKYKIVPVIKLEKPSDAFRLGRALLEGGLPVAEVTFRTAAARDAIKLLRDQYPAMMVGAGTVTTIEQVDLARDAGAMFIVTPGFNPRIVDYCLANNIIIIPGVNSPSQIEQGLERGLSLLKFFPAEASGGVKMLKALHGPYSEVSFVPTGGIDASNLLQYIQLSNVAAIGGSWMVKEDLISSGQFDVISRLCGEALTIVRQSHT